MSSAFSILGFSRALCALILVTTCLWSTEASAEGAAQTSALLLLKSTSSEGSEASFGRGASAGPASRALQEPFEAAGIRFVSAAGLVPTPGDAPAGLPLSDSAALDMARKAGVQVCVVVGIAALPKGKIRATQLVSHQARLRIRVLDVASGDAVVDTQASRFGYAPTAGPAAAAAIASAIAELGKGLRVAVRKRWRATPRSSGSSLTVTISGAQGWRPIASILKQLAASKGIQYVHALQIQSSQIQLSVSSSMSAASLVSILRRTRITNGVLSVVTSGQHIRMTLQMSAPTSPINHG